MSFLLDVLLYHQRDQVGIPGSYFSECLIRDWVTIAELRIERQLILGNNGVGKTTLLRLLLGELEPQSGTLKHGTNLEIGYSTPPVGLNLFISSFRFDKSILELYRSCLPFLGILLAALALITYVPSLSLFLGELVRGGATP